MGLNNNDNDNANEVVDLNSDTDSVYSLEDTSDGEDEEETHMERAVKENCLTDGFLMAIFDHRDKKVHDARQTLRPGQQKKCKACDRTYYNHTLDPRPITCARCRGIVYAECVADLFHSEVLNEMCSKSKHFICSTCSL